MRELQKVKQKKHRMIDFLSVKVAVLVGHADLDMTRHYLHVQEPIRQLMHSKEFPTLRIGKRMLVSKEKFLEWLNSKSKKGLW